MPPLTRRSLLHHAAITGMTLPLASAARLGRAAANDRLRLAGIGAGGMGKADLAALSSHPKVEVVAVCDVDAGNLAAAGERHHRQDSRGLLLERKDLGLRRPEA